MISINIMNIIYKYATKYLIGQGWRTLVTRAKDGTFDKFQ